MPQRFETNRRSGIRIGAVSYLNARPLTFCLARHVPDAELLVDLPSRLADGLAAGRLEVALVPSIETIRNPGFSIVSDACVASDGPVRSVKLYSRRPVEQIRSLALDEGSRTSAAMTRILLKERFGLEPELRRLPIGTSLGDSTADATMLIGDRGMRPAVSSEMINEKGGGRFEFVWDLGREWTHWTGLPFVFAMWTARRDIDMLGVNLPGVEKALATARDEGVRRLAEIARREAPALRIAEADCLSYLCDNLQFRLGDRQRQGLELFCELASRHGLVPAGAELVFYDQKVAR